MVIGIIGGSGSGKSTACLELEKLGCVIMDADAVYKELTVPGSELVKALAKEFGNEIAKAPDYILDRRKLSAIVFSDKEKLLRLNAITHKEVVNEIHSRMRLYPGRNIILDVPLLFECGLDKDCDEIWTVTADLNTRIDRLLARDHISREEIVRRIESQMSDEERISRSDLVISNNSLSELQKQLSAIAKERLN